MKAIETEYDGYKFRSRLEARWAVVFNAAKIKYQYEPEGFILSDGTKYLPDFYLPEIARRIGKECEENNKGLFVEVKGDLTKEDRNKIELFEQPILVVGDIPKQCNYSNWQDDIFFNYITIDGDNYAPRFMLNKSTNEFELWGYDNIPYEEYDMFAIEDCFDKARKARFEYGERP